MELVVITRNARWGKEKSRNKSDFEILETGRDGHPVTGEKGSRVTWID
jgi:hypothetical protein